jgi:hypothetical protein
MKYEVKRLGRGSGLVIQGMAGENLGSKKLVYLCSDGTWKLAHASITAKMPSLGITMEKINSGQGGSILKEGYIGRSDWAFTTSGRVYVSENAAGELTQTAPSNPANIIQEIGIATSPKLIWFSPRQVVGSSSPEFTKTIQISADELGRGAANNPTVVDRDNITLYSFTVNTDFMTYKLPIPSDYASGGLKFNVVWTNDGGVDDQNKNVRAQFDYQVASEGDAVSGSHGNSPKNVNDAYTSGAGWIMHYSDYVTVAESDFTGETCIFLKVSFVTAPPTALTCEPHLVGVCLQYSAYAFGYP